jgi:hypothetical protein
VPAELATSLTATEAERLEQAEALVRAYCGWHIAPSREETVTLRGVQRAMMFLPSLYVTAIESVTDDGTALTVEDDYIWSVVGVLTRVGYWSTGEVEVSFTHGYADPPAEVTAVVQAVAQRAVDNPGSLVREQRGPFAETHSQTGSNQSIPLVLLDAEKDILRRYRIVTAA